MEDPQLDSVLHNAGHRAQGVVVRTLTPGRIGPDRAVYLATCDVCAWSSARAVYVESLESIACRHVRETGHAVSIRDLSRSEATT